MPAPYSGGCQCGAIRYEITDEPTVIYACHCTECQTQSGSAFGMTVVVPSSQFKLLKGAPKVFGRTGESGRTMNCLFCADCGTRIYHEPSGIAENKNIKPGTLDDTSWVVPTVHVWLKSAQSWVQIPDETLKFEEQPKDRSWLKRK